MLRLVLIHQLVLALLVGPMLCCCTAARLGHESSRTSQSSDKSKSNEKSKPRLCCGESQPSGSEQPSHDGKPTGPEKCPCKNAPQAVVAMPEQAASAADVLTQFAAGLATFNHSVTLLVPAFTGRSTTSFLARSSNLSTDDILYAHHNLRC